MPPAPAEGPGAGGSPGSLLEPAAVIPAPFLKIFPYRTFNRVQTHAFPRVFEGNGNVVLSAPTGAGKTVIFEMAIVRMLTTAPSSARAKPKAIYIAPMKALCEERVGDWQQKFGPLGVNCVALTGDSQSDQGSDLASIRSANIICTTPEKWDSVTRKWCEREHQSFVRSFGLLLVDEIHHVTSPNRGATLEVAVTRMKTVAKHPAAAGHPIASLRILGISATFKNLSDVGEWLECRPENVLKCGPPLLPHSPPRLPPLSSPSSPPLLPLPLCHPCPPLTFDDPMYRPVRLETKTLEYPMSNKGMFLFERTLNEKVPHLIRSHYEGKPALVFCSTTKGAAECARAIAKSQLLKLVVSDAQREALRAAAQQAKSAELRECLVRGVAFHHARLALEDRRAVEDLFSRSHVVVLCSTSTLALGVNFPARLVILRGASQYITGGGGYEDMDAVQMLQMCGRAGRPQYDDRGVAIIMCATGGKARIEGILAGNILCESQLLHGRGGLEEHLNAEVALAGAGGGGVTDLAMAVEWVKGSYLAVCLRRRPGIYGLAAGADVTSHLHGICKKAVETLRDRGCVRADDDGFGLTTTPLGSTMSRFYTRLATIEAFSAAPPGADMRTCLQTLCSAAEFGDWKPRQEDKAALNELNARLPPAFALKGKFKEPRDKAYALLLAELFGEEIREWGLRSDAGSIRTAALRVARCMVEVFQVLEKGLACANAVVLGACLERRLWQNSERGLAQLGRLPPGAGPAELKLAGFASVRELREAAAAAAAEGPEALEVLAQRLKVDAALAGRVLAALPPMPAVHAWEGHVGDAPVLEIHLEGGLDCGGPHAGRPAHSLRLLVCDKAGGLLYATRFPSSSLAGEQTRRVPLADRTLPTPELFVVLVSEDYVDVDDLKSVLVPSARIAGPASSGPAEASAAAAPAAAAPKKKKAASKRAAPTPAEPSAPGPAPASAPVPAPSSAPAPAPVPQPQRFSAPHPPRSSAAHPPRPSAPHPPPVEHAQQPARASASFSAPRPAQPPAPQPPQEPIDVDLTDVGADAAEGAGEVDPWEGGWDADFDPPSAGADGASAATASHYFSAAPPAPPPPPPPAASAPAAPAPSSSSFAPAPAPAPAPAAPRPRASAPKTGGAGQASGVAPASTSTSAGKAGKVAAAPAAAARGPMDAFVKPVTTDELAAAAGEPGPLARPRRARRALDRRRRPRWPRWGPAAASSLAASTSAGPGPFGPDWDAYRFSRAAAAPPPASYPAAAAPAALAPAWTPGPAPAWTPGPAPAGAGEPPAPDSLLSPFSEEDEEGAGRGEQGRAAPQPRGAGGGRSQPIRTGDAEILSFENGANASDDDEEGGTQELEPEGRPAPAPSAVEMAQASLAEMLPAFRAQNGSGARLTAAFGPGAAHTPRGPPPPPPAAGPFGEAADHVQHGGWDFGVGSERPRPPPPPPLETPAFEFEASHAQPALRQGAPVPAPWARQRSPPAAPRPQAQQQHPFGLSPRRSQRDFVPSPSRSGSRQGFAPGAGAYGAGAGPAPRPGSVFIVGASGTVELCGSEVPSPHGYPSYHASPYPAAAAASSSLAAYPARTPSRRTPLQTGASPAELAAAAEAEARGHRPMPLPSGPRTPFRPGPAAPSPLSPLYEGPSPRGGRRPAPAGPDPLAAALGGGAPRRSSLPGASAGPSASEQARSLFPARRPSLDPTPPARAPGPGPGPATPAGAKAARAAPWRSHSFLSHYPPAAPSAAAAARPAPSPEASRALLRAALGGHGHTAGPAPPPAAPLPPGSPGTGIADDLWGTPPEGVAPRVRPSIGFPAPAPKMEVEEETPPPAAPAAPVPPERPAGVAPPSSSTSALLGGSSIELELLRGAGLASAARSREPAPSAARIFAKRPAEEAPGEMGAAAPAKAARPAADDAASAPTQLEAEPEAVTPEGPSTGGLILGDWPWPAAAAALHVPQGPPLERTPPAPAARRGNSARKIDFGDEPALPATGPGPAPAPQAPPPPKLQSAPPPEAPARLEGGEEAWGENWMWDDEEEGADPATAVDLRT
eukprot:tig00020675_g12612.t1